MWSKNGTVVLMLLLPDPSRLRESVTLDSLVVRVSDACRAPVPLFMR
jgi:hypothetical protein